LRTFGCSLLGAPCYGNGDQFVQAFGGAGTTGPATHPNLNEYSGFIQDEWRITPTFTLNPGLRYDYESLAQPPVLNPIAAQAGILTNRIIVTRIILARVSALLGHRIASINGLLSAAATELLWTHTFHLGGHSAFQQCLQVTTLTYSDTSIPVTYPNTVCGAPVTNPACPPPAPVRVFRRRHRRQSFVFNRNFVEPTRSKRARSRIPVGEGHGSYRFLSRRSWCPLQRTRDINLAGRSPATIGIAGTGTVLNYLRYPSPTGTPATCPAGLFVVTLSSPCRPNGNFQRIEEVESNSNSIYNGLIIQLNKRFGTTIKVLGSYTYGKVIDDAPDSTSVVTLFGWRRRQDGFRSRQRPCGSLRWHHDQRPNDSYSARRLD